LVEGRFRDRAHPGHRHPRDAPPEHNLPYAQSFGPEARAFAQGAFAVATEAQLVRSPTLDKLRPHPGLPLPERAQLLGPRVAARFSAETVTFYGDNGLPAEARGPRRGEVGGPVPFEPPHAFRARMRDVSKWMKEKGLEVEQ